MNITNTGVTAPMGFTASGIHCGVRKNQTKNDVMLIKSEVPCVSAGVFTSNLVKGAPIDVCLKHLKNHTAQAVIANSGNANTCNADGLEKAEMMADAVAKELKICSDDVLVASTGVIGLTLPIEPILTAIPKLAQNLSENGSIDAAKAIMTTDTKVKCLSVKTRIGGKSVNIGGICKGSGMIHPNMCTMLCFLTSDVKISAEMLDKALREVVSDTFNMISVDGDTSTNDTCCILANGLAENDIINSTNDDYVVFRNSLKVLCTELAQEMAGDGEGATKLLVCKVNGAKTKTDAKTIAKSVICSSLVKSAMFGSDANWGRVLCAIGYSGSDVNIHKVDVSFNSDSGNIEVCKDGARVSFDEGKAKTILSEDKIVIDITLHDGIDKAIAYGCDLTYDYVKINGDYRT